MPTEPNQPASTDSDPDVQSTPAGLADDLKEMAADSGATTEPNDE